MGIYQNEIVIKTKGYFDLVDITKKIEEEVKKSKIKNGVLFLFLEHNTASLVIQESDETIFEDLKNTLERLLPLDGKYKHSYEGNINATAHLKNLLLTQSVNIPIKDGKIILGTWQRIILLELLESRERRVFISIIGD